VISIHSFAKWVKSLFTWVKYCDGSLQGEINDTELAVGTIRVVGVGEPVGRVFNGVLGLMAMREKWGARLAQMGVFCDNKNSNFHDFVELAEDALRLGQIPRIRNKGCLRRA
jgi:hypothetical protein